MARQTHYRFPAGLGESRLTAGRFNKATREIGIECRPRMVDVTDEADGHLVCALRIPGTRFQPKVFRQGTYTLTLTAGSQKKTIQGLKSVGNRHGSTLEVDLR